MKLLATICMPALMLGATALMTQAMAQADAATQPAQDANSATAPNQTAMNTTGNASDLSSIPDNQHKYNRAKRAADNSSEDRTTKQLNEQEASLNGASRSAQ